MFYKIDVASHIPLSERFVILLGKQEKAIQIVQILCFVIYHYSHYGSFRRETLYFSQSFNADLTKAPSIKDIINY